jgi:hypothetical protein
VSSDTYVPRHRGAPSEPKLAKHAKRGIKKGFLFSGIAVAATGVTVTSGVALRAHPGSDTMAATLAGAPITAPVSQPAAEPTVDRERSISVSRSDDRRDEVDRTKALVLSQESGGQVTRTKELASGDPRDIARAMLAEYGWSQSQFGCLDSLFTRESNWSPTAANRYSGAYGIPQALPGTKMASAGADWRYNPETQIRWGLGYIQARYGSPCGAWGHSQSHGWY